MSFFYNLIDVKIEFRSFFAVKNHRMSKILITSALPYVNNVPHLGNIVGCVLSADVCARFNRLIGKDVLYVCGTDEYGTATENKALELGLTPREVCDKYHALHKEIYDWFNISFDVFGRTSTPNPGLDDWAQTRITQDIFKKLVENDLICEKEVDQLYCETTGRFLSDRQVIGTCPHCKHDDVSGEQCDFCCLIYPSTTLINPKSKANPDHALTIKKSWHLFFQLPKLQQKVKEWWNSPSRSELSSKTAIGITKSWLEEELHERCITRDLEWGTPVPDTEMFGNKYKNKVFYVWFDAPIGYISITANEREDWKDWWMPEKETNVQQYNFMAKDNVVFHSVVFPATLIGTGDPYKLTNAIDAVEYLSFGKKLKFSKSKKIGIFGDDAKESGICADVWRFYLMRIRPESADSCFQWDDFTSKVNGELVNNFSNLVNRVLSLTYKNYGQIPTIEDKNQFEELESKYQDTLQKYIENSKHFRLREALTDFLNFSGICNTFLQEKEPWQRIKEDPTYARNSLAVACHFIICLSVMASPFIPDATKKIHQILNIEHGQLDLEFNKFAGTKINKPTIIFKRLQEEDLNKLKSKFS